MKKDLTRRGGQGLAGYDTILTEVAGLIDDARRSVARTVNTTMTTLYWLIGRRMVESEQSGKVRAGYGEELVERLSADLSARYGRGFSVRNLWHMKAFYLAWPEAQGHEIPQTASAESAPTGKGSRFLPPDPCDAPNPETSGHGAWQPLPFVQGQLCHDSVNGAAMTRSMQARDYSRGYGGGE